MTSISRLRRLVPAASAAALVALLLAGCSGGGSTAEYDGGPALEAPVAPEGGSAEDFAADASAEAERSVITTGWIQLTVDDPVASAAEAVRLTEEADGRVDSRTESPGTDTQPAHASLTLRIPADRLDDVVAELRELGRVDQVSMNASDVTQQRQDLDARIEALTASVDRLRELLASAATTTDLIAIESELTTRQAELDSLTQQRDQLVDQVEYSTVTLELVTEGVAPTAGPDDFWSGLTAGWDALVAFLSAALVALGVALPWIGLMVLLAAIVVAIVLAATAPGRRRARDADAARAAQAQPSAEQARAQAEHRAAEASDRSV